MKRRGNRSPFHDLELSDGRNAVEVARGHISFQAFRWRLKNGWSVDRAATAPAKPGRFSARKVR